MVAKVVIKGGNKLSGKVRIMGAKNSVLELVPATLLTDEKVVLKNVPVLKDVETIVELMKAFGTDVQWDKENCTLTLQTKEIISNKAPYEIVKTMRASIYVLGALLGRCGSARGSFPGGCVIGTRPIDIHVRAMKCLGASVETIHGYIVAKVPTVDGETRLIGDVMDLLVTEKSGHKITTHGGCVNAILAAVLAKGQTVIENASMEPELDDLISMLNLMGAKIKRDKYDDGTDVIIVDGVDKLHGCEYSVMPDRMEAMTYAIVGAMNGGVVEVQNIDTSKMEYFLEKFKEAGVVFDDKGDSLIVYGDKTKLKAVDVETLPYPGFPTDIQSPFMTLISVAEGKSTLCENVWENRFQCVQELQRMGANADIINPNTVCFTGVESLDPTDVIASELRGGMALVLAGLVAKPTGYTNIHRAYHIFRGYANFAENLRNLGAEISIEDE